jgi:hypothetical protein
MAGLRAVVVITMCRDHAADLAGRGRLYELCLMRVEDPTRGSSKGQAISTAFVTAAKDASNALVTETDTTNMEHATKEPCTHRKGGPTRILY